MTYATMLTAAGITLLFCALLYGFLFLTSHRAEKTIKTLQAEIERLKIERERIIGQKTTLQGQGPFLEIQKVLENAPSWSTLLETVSRSLPSRVWLASLKSADKASSPQNKEILLNGQAKNAQVLATFLANLGKSPYFDKVVLTTSSEEAVGLFQFSISCDIGKNTWTSKP